jgi:hypothetical protein
MNLGIGLAFMGPVMSRGRAMSHTGRFILHRQRRQRTMLL